MIFCNTFDLIKVCPYFYTFPRKICIGKTGTDLADLVFVVKLRERCEVREAATATKRNVVKRSEEAGAIAEH